MPPAAIGETSGMVFFVWLSVFNLFATMVFRGLMATTSRWPCDGIYCHIDVAVE